MLLDRVLGNPLVRRAIAAGEEQMGRAVGRLLGDDRLGGGLHTLASSAAHARATLERGVRQALHAANLPSADDVGALKKRLDDIEAMLDGLADKVGRGKGGGA
jgi:hypothetical protein